MSFRKEEVLLLIGLLLRIVFVGYDSSGVFSHFYLPFMDTSVQGFMTGATLNPWDLSPAEYFPYGLSLFIILLPLKFIGYLIFGDIFIGGGFVSVAPLKTPLLICDFVFLCLMQRIAPQRQLQILYYYWLNPVLIYITFFKGYLDLIPMFFVFWSMLSLIQQRIKQSAVLFGVALTSKFHVAVIFPIILYYLWNTEFPKRAIRHILQFCVLGSVIVMIGFFPVIESGKLLYNSIGSPEAFRLFSLKYELGQGIVVYLGAILVVAAIGRIVLSTKLTGEGLIFGSGFVFGVLLLATNPMPGWYFWIIPFVVLFYSLYSFVPKSLWLALVILYFLVFTDVSQVVESAFFSNGRESLFHGVLFSLLQLVVIIYLGFICVMILRTEASLKRRSRPMLIGLAGDSGAGKNTLSHVLKQLFGLRQTEVIEGDDYHKWERGDVHWQTYTHLHPRANHLEVLNRHVNELVQGKYVFQPHYDHNIGRFTAPRPLNPTKTLLVQGLHSLYIRSMREVYDLKIFLNPDPSLRKFWKVKRDCNERGYSLEKVLDSFQKREKDSRKHIDPQKNDADLVIEYFPIEPISEHEILQIQSVSLGLRVSLWNDVQVLDLVESLNTINTIQCSFDEHRLDQEEDRIMLTFVGDISKENIESIVNTLFIPLRFLVRAYEPPQFMSGYDGILQLIILAILKGKR